MAKAIDNLAIMLEIAAERERQVTAEGFTPDHDRLEHRNGELARAAGCYALHGRRHPIEPPLEWPWHHFWWRPKTRRRDLIRAAALIVAEIERLDDEAEREAADDPHGAGNAAASPSRGGDVPGGDAADG